MVLEKTDQVVSQSIQLLNDFAQKGIEFIQQQSPELCQQIVLRAEFQCITIFIIFFIISATLFYLSKKWQKYEEKVAAKGINQFKNYVDECESAPSTYFFTRFVQIFSLIPFFIWGSMSLYSFISIYVAPKVYLVEYFSQLIKR